MADPRPPRPLAALDRERQQAIQRLCEVFAADGFSERELEQRLDAAYRAATPAELRELTADLPAASAPAPIGNAPAPHLAPGERQAVVAVMGGAERRGDWAPPREVYAIAVMGGVELDFRHARFTERLTEITCFALMGGVEIVVPPGVRVELSGAALMGGFGQSGTPDAQTDPDAPTLRISGICLMGGVGVEVRLPGETAKEARKREALERKRQARLRAGR